MDATTILHHGRTAVEVLADRLAEMLCALPSTSAMVSPEWTVRDAAAHLVTSTALYAELAAGAASPITELTPAALSAFNARRLADIADTEPAALAKAVTAAVDHFLDATGGSGTTPVRWHGGIRLQLAQLPGILVGEYLLHGYDIAVPAGAVWPISVEHVALASHAMRSLLHVAVDPVTGRGHTAGYRIDLGSLGCTTLRFADGTVSATLDDDGPVDCVITADPVAFFLVRQRRLAPTAATALGLLRFGGRRPDLGPVFLRLFRTF